LLVSRRYLQKRDVGGKKKLQDLETKTDENNRKKGQQKGKKKRKSKIIVVTPST